jgi:RNA polymerase sigma factor (sigma-70 family)
MATAIPARDRRGEGQVDVPVLLACWRTREISYARTFRECGGASPTEIEDLYDATVTALVEKDKTYESEEHLRAAVHKGIRMRALRLHRDRRARALALEQAAPSMLAVNRERAWRQEPERALIAHEDDLIIGEFLAELTKLERQVFALVADGRSWRAIATALSLSEGEARTRHGRASKSETGSSRCTAPAGCAATARTPSARSSQANSPANSRSLKRLRTCATAAHASTNTTPTGHACAACSTLARSRSYQPPHSPTPIRGCSTGSETCSADQSGQHTDSQHPQPVCASARSRPQREPAPPRRSRQAPSPS